MSVAAATVCFIVCHAGPADHFATFAANLPSEVVIYASGPALKKLEERNISGVIPFSSDQDTAVQQIVKACAQAKLVITDVGDPFDIKIQKALAFYAQSVSRFAYYDNPKPYVPGGYSETAAKVMQASQGVLFANANLSQTQLYSEPGKEVDLREQKK